MADDQLIKRLGDRRAKVFADARALAEEAANENRAFTGEEQSQWDQMNAEITDLDKRMSDMAAGLERAKAVADKFADLDGRPREVDDPDEQTRNDELRAFLLGEQGAPRFFEVKPPKGQIVNYRDLVKGTATAGGNTVPTSFYNRLVEHMIEVSGVLQSDPTILNTTSGENIQIPKTTAHGTAAITPEGTNLPENDPTFGQVTLGAYKYGELIQVSRELVEDTGVDLEGYLARMAGRAIGNALGAHLVTGTGTSQPRGVVTDATTGVTPAAGLIAGGGFGTQNTADQGFDIMINLFHSVISPYRNSASCAWLMNDSTAARVRKIKDTAGQYIWQPAVTVGAPDTILGKPVFIDPFVANVGANAKSVVFGDLAQYFVRLVGGVRFERSDDFAFGSDLVSFRAVQRADGSLVDLTGAVKTLTHPAT